jgi:hypothetical protein
MTFEVNGKQYVAIVSGPVAAPGQARQFTGDARSAHAMVLYVFGL